MDTAHTLYGAPEISYLSFDIIPQKSGAILNLTLVLWNKTPTRLPEQLMFEFAPKSKLGNLDWSMDKLGGWVSPLDVILNGSQYQHAVWSGVKGTDSKNISTVTILTPDAPLVAPITTQSAFHGWFGTPTAMPVPTAALKGVTTVTGFGINLFNNVWDTNYILWYPYLETSMDQNMLFRFSVQTNSAPQLSKHL